MSWLDRVRIFDFDNDVIAAFSEEEAIQHFKRTGGFEEEDISPEGELDLDAGIIVTDEEGCTCPYCGGKWANTTWKQILIEGNYKEDDLPAIIGGRD
jgi:hypothetical protein